MRVGILTRNYPPMQGGMARHAAGLARALYARNDVCVYAPRYAEQVPGGPPLNNSLDRNVTNCAHTVGNTDVDLWFALSAPFAPLATVSNVPFVLFFHGNDFLYPIFDPSHSVEGRLDRIPLIWRALPGIVRRLYRVPRIHHLLVQRRRRLLTESLGHASLVLFNSNFTRDLARRIYEFGDVPTDVLHPGCDEKFFQARRPGPPGTLRLLTVANLSTSNRRKNVDGVLEALRLVTDEVNCRYVVIGDGDDLPRLRGKAQELGVAEQVSFLGRADDDVLLRAYAESDLFILAPRASEYDVEGFGMVYIEANAAGLPVIASAEGGALDAVVSGQTGIVLDQSSAEHIANAIRNIARRRIVFDEARIREHAALFRWTNVGDRLDGLLTEYLPSYLTKR